MVHNYPVAEGYYARIEKGDLSLFLQVEFGLYGWTYSVTHIAPEKKKLTLRQDAWASSLEEGKQGIGDYLRTTLHVNLDAIPWEHGLHATDYRANDG